MMHWMAAVVLVFALAAGCARDTEAELRSRLGEMFYLGATISFVSQQRCTAAVFAVNDASPRPVLPVETDPNNAKEAFSMEGRVAFRMEGFSPNDLADELLMTGRGTFGQQALASAAQAVPCFAESAAEASLRNALTRQGAILAYDRKLEAMIVLDPDQMRLFFVAGDTW